MNGGLYAEHVLDLGEAPGVIAWWRCAQGQLEFDAGVLLATTWKIGFRNESILPQVARAERALLAQIADFLDVRAVTWYGAIELLRFARRQALVDHPARARSLLAEAKRLVPSAA